MEYIQIGIDTISYYHNLTSKQKNALIAYLKVVPGFRTVKESYWENTYVYASDYFASQGIRLKIFRYQGSIWGMYVIIHPTLILGEPDRSALYQATKKSYTKIIKTADRLLKTVKVPCSLDDMRLYRIDVTMNIIFKDAAFVPEYIRILKKSLILPHYKLDWFRKGENKARNREIANCHSYKQKCKAAAFFAYDKTAQLEMIDQFPNRLIGKKVLRIEGQFRPKALKRWTSRDNNWQIVKDTYKNASKILKWYIDRVQPKGDILRYKDAVNTINNAKMKDKTRDRMLYLLRKTSDKDSLSAALKSLEEKYRLSKSQCNTILRKFRQLGISPITLPNTSEFDILPGLREYISKDRLAK